MKKALRWMLPALALVAGTAGAVPAWEEVSTGSGTLPGPFRLGAFNPALNEENRVSIRPELGLSLEGRLLLSFYSDTLDTRQSSYNGIFALVNNGGEWAFQTNSPKGEVFAADYTYMRHPGGMAGSYSLVSLIPSDLTPAGAPSVYCVFPFINDPEQINIYAGVYASLYSSSGWAARDGSLAPGGIAGTPAFATQIFDTAGALDTFGNPYVAYTRGSERQKAIYVRQNKLGAWSGLAGSDVTPIAAASSTVSNYHAAIGFTGADPVVAWTEKQSTLERVKLKRYQSSTEQWIAIGTSVSEGLGYGRNPQIANFQNRDTFFVAFEDLATKKLYLKESNGLTITDRGDPLAPWGLAKMAPFDDKRPSAPEPAVANFALALDRQGRPAVAFRAESPVGSGRTHIFVSWLSRDNVWVAQGDTANPLGLDGLEYELADPMPAMRGYGNYNPSMVFGLDNRPIVAWEFDDGNRVHPAILVRRSTEPVSTLPVTVDQAIGRLLGTIAGAVELDAVLDDNRDGIVDAADVERLQSRLGR